MKIEKSTRWLSRAAVALGVAALVNVWLQFGHPLAKVPTANLDTGEVAKAVAAFKRDAKAPAPRIVLLGSSLVLAPVMQAEAQFSQTSIERMNHRRSNYLEAQLSSLPERPQVFCLAIGGEMVSDAFLLVKNILDGAHKPDAIVFGIAPRDFQDNLLPGVQSTESFKVLAGPADVAHVLKHGQLSFENSADMVLCECLPLWRYRNDIRVYALLRSKKLMEACMPWVVFDKYGVTAELKPRRKGQFPEEAHGTPLIFPNIAMHHTSVQATHDEYNRRYNPLNQQLVAQQFDYLDRLLGLCKRRDIKILMVNMPLSRDNLALVPAGFYAYYKARLQQACKTHDTELVDMCDGRYSRDDIFADGVHLDTGISQPFLQDVCRRLQTSRLAATFNKSI